MRTLRTKCLVAHGRLGMANLEVVMTMAIMLPIAGALFFLGVKMCATIYQAIGALVAWPFL